VACYVGDVRLFAVCYHLTALVTWAASALSLATWHAHHLLSSSLMTTPTAVGIFLERDQARSIQAPAHATPGLTFALLIPKPFENIPSEAAIRSRQLRGRNLEVYNFIDLNTSAKLAAPEGDHRRQNEDISMGLSTHSESVTKASRPSTSLHSEDDITTMSSPAHSYPKTMNGPS
jgi:hypothetical protein